MRKSQVRLLRTKHKAMPSKANLKCCTPGFPAATDEGQVCSEHSRYSSNSKRAERWGKDHRLENWLSGTSGGKKKRKTFKGLFRGLIKVPFEYPSIKQSAKGLLSTQESRRSNEIGYGIHLRCKLSSIIFSDLLHMESTAVWWAGWWSTEQTGAWLKTDAVASAPAKDRKCQ